MIARVRHVSKHFGAVRAVDDVSFEVERGEIVGLIGANGAGKTTAIRLLLGLVPVTSGDVELFGSSPTRDSVRRVGYVPQGLGLYSDLTPRQNMAFQAGVFGFAAPPPLTDLAGWWDVPVCQIPLGVRRRVAFEVAVGHDPELLILDEPTSGVGPLGRARLWETFRARAERGIGVLVTTHHLEEAEQCDRLVMMAGGRVVAEGPLEAILGGQTAVAVRTSDWDRVIQVLAGPGVLTTATSSGVRVVGSDADQVRKALGGAGLHPEVHTEPVTLEEAFVRLSR